MAAQQASKEQIAVMADALAHMKLALGQGQDPLAGDELFHRAIAQACGNEVLRDTISRYWQARRSPLYLRLADYFERPASWRSVLAEHSAVLKAIKNRDPGAARKAMQGHLSKALARFSAGWHLANPPAPTAVKITTKVKVSPAKVSAENVKVVKASSKPTRRHHAKKTIKT
jgi:DNA-binding FadR family transcriptional regulator